MRDELQDSELIDDTDSGEPPMTEETEVPMLLDAELHGESTPEMEKLLDTPATFMAGQLYDQGDRRNTRDGDWKETTFTWYEWLAMEKIGLCNHPVAKGKQGPSLVFAEALGGARKDSAIKTMYAVGLDIDSGATLKEVMEKLIKLEIFAIVYTSFSHGKSVLELKHDDIVRKLKLDDTPNRAQVQAYLREHHKDRYDADFIDSIIIKDARHQTKDGLRVVVETPALDKFRVILPLAEPVELADLGATMAQYKEAWENAVCGVAVNTLGVNFDASSCDVNRLFYTPRHPADAEDWYCAVVQGDPLSFDEIKPYSKNAYVNKRDDSDPFSAGTEGTNERENYMTPKGVSLNRWHKEHKERFLITDVIEQFCDDKIRKAGNERAGTVHVECCFEHEHSTTGGTATMCMNPTENSEGYWTVFCRHDACQGRDKLHFLQEMLEQGWFEEDVLTDDEFNLGAEDSEIEDDAVIESLSLTPAEAKERVEVAELNSKSRQSEMESFIAGLLEEDADIITESNVQSALVAATGLGIRKIGAIWNLVKDKHRVEKRSNGKVPVIGEWGDPEMVAYAEKKLSKSKDHNGDPVIYTFEGDYCVIKNNNREMLALPTFKARLDDASEWEDKNGRKVLSPDNVAKHCYFRDGKPGAELAGIKTTPYFDPSWRRIDRHGYNSTTAIYLAMGNLDVPRVSEQPSKEEVLEAVRLFVEEVFGDFPIGGLTRKELVQKVIGGEPVPDFANLLGMVLQLFCRDAIKGFTPLYTLTKPDHGTGASLVVDIMSLIGLGEETAPQTLPPSAEEMQKSLLAFVVGGGPICYFDNIDKAISSGPLASALTAKKFSGRMLQTSRYVEAPVNHLWVATAVSVEAHDELIRRMVWIELDAKVAHPEERSDWRHDDIGAWVRENRGQLVWAALTLIQNWIAKGQPEFEGPLLNSYENWSRVIGGIVAAAGVKGFLGNNERKKSYAQTGDSNAVQLLMERIAEECSDGDIMRPGGFAKVRDMPDAKVHSACEILNRSGEPDEISGKDTALFISYAWGWNKETESYRSSTKVAAEFRKAARKTWECEGYELHFEEHQDPKDKKLLTWIVRKRPLPAKTAE
ncbi:hypothetical protein [Boseongicola sp. H5]|uniref:hypothetical protein n=1 Tax=Boseongicola sp. H5 TaxID=2763261 RepID=UPI001D0B0926|nr:hypothetical protein [Boseongicola sp. H5]